MDPPAPSVLDRMTDAFFALDEEWRFTYLNEAGREIISEAAGREATVDELVGAEIWEEIPEAVDTPFYEQYTRAMRTQEPVSFEDHYDPLETWFEVRAYPDEAGLSVYFRDVSERRRREDTLENMYRVISDKRASLEEKVDTLLAIGRDVLDTEYGALSRVEGDDYVFEIVHDPAGETQPGDTIPLSATNCERAIVTEQTLVLEDIAEDAPELAERTGYTEMGVECYLGTPVVVDGEVYGTFCFYDREPRTEPFSDWEVTLVELMGNWVSYEHERVRRRRELSHERNRLDSFASVVSHDLRGPLSVASGRVDLAREERDSAHLEDAAEALARMDELVEDVLAIARAEQADLTLESTSLAEVARDAWATAADDGGSLTVEDATLLADGSRLRQLLENLLANAVEHGSTSPQQAGDAVDDGRTATTAGDGPTGPSVEVGPLTEGTGFFVADDGPGIPPEDREEVFEPGYSTRTDGTGFGLDIVRTICDVHGWDVTVGESDAGGARFEISGVEPA